MLDLNVYDFDKTIYYTDSTLDFYLYSLKKNILLIRYLPIQIYGFLLYKLNIKEKEFFKEKFFSFLKGIKNIDNHVEEFWNLHKSGIKKWFLDKKQENVVVISASPEFLLNEICKSIGVDKLIATKVNKNTGKFESKNCYGKEKLLRLNKEYDKYRIINFYSDSYSDKYLANIAKNSFIVNKDEIKKWREIDGK